MRSPRNICSIIGGLAGVPLGGIEGISIQSGGAPPNVPITTKIEIFQSPPPPPPPPPPAPPEAQFGNFNVSGTLGGLVGEIVGQFLTPFSGPVGPFRGQPAGAPPEVPPSFRLQPSGETVPELDFGFRSQRGGQVTGEVQTLNTGREFRPSQEIQTLDQGNIQTGQGGQNREITTTRQQTTTRGQQTLETIEQSRQDFQAGRFVDPPGELDYVAPAPPVTAASESGRPKPCATCSMLNQDPNAKDSYPVEMIFHFKNHASAQRLGGLCEADGECEIA